MMSRSGRPAAAPSSSGPLLGGAKRTAVSPSSSAAAAKRATTPNGSGNGGAAAGNTTAAAASSSSVAAAPSAVAPAASGVTGGAPFVATPVRTRGSSGVGNRVASNGGILFGEPFERTTSSSPMNSTSLPPMSPAAVVEGSSPTATANYTNPANVARSQSANRSGYYTNNNTNSHNNHGGSGPSFVELIRAREQQQQRIRSALEDQNDQLQNRLRNAIDSRDTTINVNDFLTFVTEMKELVVRGNEAEVAAFRALNDKVERQEQYFEQRFQEYEARMIAADRTRELVREEQMEQTLSVSGEVEQLKDAMARVEAHIAAHAEANEQTVVFSERVASALQDIEERVVSVEALPDTVRQTLVEMEMRLNQVQLDAQEDLRKIRERYPDTEDKLTLVMTRAEENLLLLQQHADAAIMAADHQQQRIEELIDNGITTLGRGLEGMLDAKYKEHAVRLSEGHEAMAKAVGAQEAAVMEAVAALRQQADDYLASLDKAHADSVTEALAQLEHRAADFEAERLKKYPVADPDRIEAMVKELEGAFTAVEGIVRANLTGGINLDHPYIQRLEALESSVAFIQGGMGDADAGPKAYFSTDTQTAIDGPHRSASSGGGIGGGGAFAFLSSPIGSSSFGDAARFKAQLRHEEDVISTEQSADQIAKAVDLIVARANSRPSTPLRGPSAAAAAAQRIATPTNSTAPTPREIGAGNHYASNRSFDNTNGGVGAYSFNGSNSVTPNATSLPARGAGGAAHHNSSAAVDTFAVTEELKKKEAAVERIQSVLKEIAIKFKEISDREMAIGGHNSSVSTSPAQEETNRQVMAVIAKQKAAIYEKERQLLEKRNELLREIKDLRATLSSAGGEGY